MMKNEIPVYLETQILDLIELGNIKGLYLAVDYLLGKMKKDNKDYLRDKDVVASTIARSTILD